MSTRIRLQTDKSLARACCLVFHHDAELLVLQHDTELIVTVPVNMILVMVSILRVDRPPLLRPPGALLPCQS